MAGYILPDERLPLTRFAELERGEFRSRASFDIFGGKRAVIIGVPGAFTPVCSRVHLPRFVELAPAILASGLDMIVCVAPNDPWSLAAWAERLDPSGRLRFLSDGNLEFGRACGLTLSLSEFFFGESLRRFSMIVTNCVVEKVSVEKAVMDVSCSSADACMLSDRPTASMDA